MTLKDPTLDEVVELYETFKRLTGSPDSAAKILLAYALLKRPAEVPKISQVEDSTVRFAGRDKQAVLSAARRGWMTCDEAAAVIGVSISVVRARIKKKLIQARKVNGVWQIALPAVAIPDQAPPTSRLKIG